MNDKQAVWQRYPNIRIRAPGRNPHGLYSVWMQPHTRQPLLIAGDSIQTVYRLLRQMIEWECKNVPTT